MYAFVCVCSYLGSRENEPVWSIQDGKRETAEGMWDAKNDCVADVTK